MSILKDVFKNKLPENVGEKVYLNIDSLNLRYIYNKSYNNIWENPYSSDGIIVVKNFKSDMKVDYDDTLTSATLKMSDLHFSGFVMVSLVVPNFRNAKIADRDYNDIYKKLIEDETINPKSRWILEAYLDNKIYIVVPVIDKSTNETVSGNVRNNLPAWNENKLFPKDTIYQNAVLYHILSNHTLWTFYGTVKGRDILMYNDKEVVSTTSKIYTKCSQSRLQCRV